MKIISIQPLVASLLILLTLLNNSCATILNSKKQDVVIQTSHSDAKVYVDDEEVGKGKAVPVELERDMVPKQVKIDRDGYEPEYYAIAQVKKSPLHILSWIPFGVLLYPPFMDSGDKAQNYPKESPLYTCDIPYGERLEDDKYLFLNKTSFNVEAGNLVTTRIKLKDYYNGKYKHDIFPNSNAISNEDIQMGNTIFSDALNEVLKERKFVDTTNVILKDITNTLYLEADIERINLFSAYASWMNTGAVSIFFVELDLTWKILDAYKQVKLEKNDKIMSGEFPGTSFSIYGGSHNKDDDGYLFKSIQDALRRSLFKLIDSDDYTEIRKIEEKNIDFEELEIAYSDDSKDINDISSAMKACVTIKTDEGHGSGFFISEDGYVVTNFHVVANAESIKVINSDQDEFEAKIIRKNPFDDVALLKIDGSTSATFKTSNFEKGEIGQDIFAIGTPSSMELTQTLSKGIISGHRKVGENKIYQTDASINSGNSGGPLVSKEGKLIGVVNAKVVGKGVEGIGFAIPIERVFKGLNLKYIRQ